MILCLNKGGLKAVRFSVPRKCETEKLWHPLLLKRFPDGRYLHRPAVVMQTWQRAGGTPSSLTEKMKK